MQRFEPGKIYYYRYLNDDPWYHYILVQCTKRTPKTATFQRSNGTTYTGRIKPTWQEDAEQVKLDGWIWLESTHEFKPGLEECSVETMQEAEALFAGLKEQPAQKEQPDRAPLQPEAQPAPIIRLVNASSAPFAVLVDD